MTGVIVCAGLSSTKFRCLSIGEDPTPTPKNLLNEVTDREPPPPQMRGEGRGRAGPRRDKRSGEQRRGREEGARAGEAGR